MTSNEQAKLVKDLGKAIINDLAREIKEGRVPKEWTGVQLRQWIAERFQRVTVAMNPSQRRQYDNDVLENNL